MDQKHTAAQNLWQVCGSILSRSAHRPAALGGIHSCAVTRPSWANGVRVEAAPRQQIDARSSGPPRSSVTLCKLSTWPPSSKPHRELAGRARARCRRPSSPCHDPTPAALQRIRAAPVASIRGPQFHVRRHEVRVAAVSFHNIHQRLEGPGEAAVVLGRPLRKYGGRSS